MTLMTLLNELRVVRYGDEITLEDGSTEVYIRVEDSDGDYTAVTLDEPMAEQVIAWLLAWLQKRGT